MDVKEFISRYQEAFGEAAPLPIAFGYSDKPASEIKKVPKCMIGAISKVRNGESLTLCEENVLCGGGGLYTAFREMPDRVPGFVSEIEHYKKTKEMVLDYVKSLDIHITEKPYLNFIRVDKLENWDEAEALLFFATPYMLSGLCTWAFYDNNSPDANSLIDPQMLISPVDMGVLPQVEVTAKRADVKRTSFVNLIKRPL